MYLTVSKTRQSIYWWFQTHFRVDGHNYSFIDCVLKWSCAPKPRTWRTRELGFPDHSTLWLAVQTGEVQLCLFFAPTKHALPQPDWGRLSVDLSSTYNDCSPPSSCGGGSANRTNCSARALTAGLPRTPILFHSSSRDSTDCVSLCVSRSRTYTQSPAAYIQS